MHCSIGRISKNDNIIENIIYENRTMRYSDQHYAFDRRTRHYNAYREWRRLNAVQNEDFAKTPQEPSISSSEEN